MAPPPTAQAEIVDLSRLLRALRRQKWVLVGSVIVWVMLSVFYVITTPKSFVAATRVILDSNLQRSTEQFGGMQRVTDSESMMEGARLLIQSDAIALAVVERLSLDSNMSYLNPPSSALAQGMGAVIGVIRWPLGQLKTLLAGEPAVAPQAAGLAGSEVSPEVAAVEQAEAMRHLVARSLQARIGVQRIGRSSAFSIFFTSHDPVLAADIVNAYAEAYIADILNANFEATERTTEWLQSRLGYLEQSAREAAEVAERYRVENGLVSSRGALISESSVSRLNEDLSGAISEVARTQAMVEAYQSVVARGVEALKQGVNIGLGDEGDQTFVQNQQRLSEMVGRLSQIESSFGPDHPQAVTIRTQVDTLADRLFSEVERRLSSAEGALSIAMSRVEALKQSLVTAVDQNSEDAAGQINLRALEQRAETLSALYETFLTKFQEVDQQRSFPLSNVRVITRADVPEAASAPSASRALLAAIILGLITGLVITAIREWRERYLRTAEDVSTYVGAAFLGYLPVIPVQQQPMTISAAKMDPVQLSVSNGGDQTPVVRRIARPRDLFVLSHMRSVYAETLRNIRLISEISATGASHRILGITSIRPGEGKTTLSLNLAAIIRASGNSVLIIDADVRNPGLSRKLRIEAGDGLLGVIAGKAGLADAVCEISGTGVHVLPCVVPRQTKISVEVLSSRAMKDILAEARSLYDYVIVDAAPLGPVVDARVLLPSINEMILVAEWGKTKKGLLRETLTIETALAEKLLGVVLSKVDMEVLPRYLNDTNIESYYDQYSDYVSTAKR